MANGHDMDTGGLGAWIDQFKPVLTALAGAGGVGAVLTFLAKVLPSGDRRLDEHRDRRKEFLDRIHELETDLEAMTVKRNEEVEKRIKTMQQMVIFEAQLALLRKNLGIADGQSTEQSEHAGTGPLPAPPPNTEGGDPA